MNIACIRNKYLEHKAIQCICDAFDYPNSLITMRARAPLKVLKVLMWNRGVHMVLAGSPQDGVRFDSRDYNKIWEYVIQTTIDSEVFGEDNVVIVREIKETPNGLLIWFEVPTGKHSIKIFRKRLLKIKRKFMEFDSWGNHVLEPFVP